jgi:hypothetical protein
MEEFLVDETACLQIHLRTKKIIWQLQPDNTNIAPFHPRAETFQNAKSLRGPWGSQTTSILQSRHDPHHFLGWKKEISRSRTL